jgi:hypothetical protein
MTTDNFCFNLQNRLIQTSQTGGQQCCDTSPFSIPWLVDEQTVGVGAGVGHAEQAGLVVLHRLQVLVLKLLSVDALAA